MYQQPQSYADMFAQAKQELFKQTDAYWKRKAEEFETEFFSKYDPSQQEASWHVQLSKEEYYLLCILVGHLIPNNGITGSLLDKFSLNLECRDYDRLEFKIGVVNNQADVQMKLNEFNLENK